MDDSIADSPHAPRPDIYYSLWNLVWVKQAILDLQTNPYHTDFLFFPQGEDLYLHPLTLVNAIFSIPLILVTDNVFFSWNVLALIFFAFSGMAMYALAYRFSSNHIASVLAGFIFAFSPFVMMQFVGRWNISTVWPIPLLALFLFRFLDRGRLGDAVIVGVLWAALMYNNQEYALDSAMLVGLFLLYWSFVYLRRRERDRLQQLWRGVAVTGGVWLVIGAPLIIGAWTDSRSGEYILAAQDEHYSADAVSYVTPSPLWGPGKHPVPSCCDPPNHDPVGSVENALYLGGVPLILATLAFVRVRKNPHAVLFWAMIVLVFVVLSFGPHLYLDGRRLSLPMPYQLYDQLPVFGDRRVPARMAPFVVLGLSVLAAVGFDILLSWLKRYGRLVAPAAAVVIVGLVVLEFWNPPVHLSALPRPAILEQIRDEPGNFAVLDAPLGRRDGWLFNGSEEGSNVSDYYAFLHGKRAFGGFVGRMKESSRAWLREEPGLRFLSFPWEPPLPDDLDPTAARAVFNKYRIKYVILHKTGPHDAELPNGQPIDTPERLDQMDRYLREVIGLPVIASDPSMTVYRNPEVQ